MATRVLLATGDESLDRVIGLQPSVEVAAVVHYREAVRSNRAPAEIAVLSTRLPGQITLCETVLPLRLAGTRVMIIGPAPFNPEDLEELLLLGVYDILVGDQPLASIGQALALPATLQQGLDAIRDLYGKRPAGGGARVREFLRGWRASGADVSATGRGSPGGAAALKTGGVSVDDRPREQVAPYGRPVVAIWSPFSAGKSFIAAELAAALGTGGVPGLLVDLDLRYQGLGGRLIIPQGMRPLAAALTAIRDKGAIPAPLPVWDGLWAYADSSAHGLVADPQELRTLLDHGGGVADWCVVDVGTGSPLADEVLGAAHLVVLVADPDWWRLAVYQEALRNLREAGQEVAAVVNRWAVIPHGTPGQVFGVEPTAVFPLSDAAYRVPVLGRPAQDYDPRISQAAQGLARAVAAALARPTRVRAGHGGASAC